MMKESFIDRLKRLWYDAADSKDFLKSVDTDLRDIYKSKLKEEIRILETILEVL